MPFTRSLAADIAGNEPDGVRQIRRTYNEIHAEAEGWQIEARDSLAWRKRAFSPEQVAARRDAIMRAAAPSERGAPLAAPSSTGSRTATSGSESKGAAGAEVLFDLLLHVEGQDLGAGDVEVEAIVGAHELALVVTRVDDVAGVRPVEP